MKTLLNIFRIKELRNRILFTIGLLIIFRVGSFIPIPGIDRAEVYRILDASTKSQSGSLIDFLDFFAGGALKQFSIFMLGIMPYITTSIIMNLLTLAFPKLKKIQEEEGGRKKIQRYTRLATIPVCMVQAFMIRQLMSNFSSAIAIQPVFLFYIVSMLSVTAGTIFLMWMGEQITQRGIGNGISILIFAGIVARMPQAILQLIDNIQTGKSDTNPVFLLVAFALFVLVVYLIIYEQQGQRKIPVNYAKRVVGRKVYGSQNTYLPFKINPSGVIPVIFASAVLSFPVQILRGIANTLSSPWLGQVANALSPGKFLYLLVYTLFIIFFAYFYTQVSLNPLEIAKNIRENGGSIPGIRSEKMESYLTRILNRIVLPGALFLAGIALIPTLVQTAFNFPPDIAYLLGGTSLIIMVGVDLDTMSQIEGHLKMHHHDGLVKKGRIRSRYL